MLYMYFFVFVYTYILTCFKVPVVVKSFQQTKVGITSIEEQARHQPTAAPVLSYV